MVGGQNRDDRVRPRLRGKLGGDRDGRPRIPANRFKHNARLAVDILQLLGDEKTILGVGKTIGVSNTSSASVSAAVWKVECKPMREMNCFGRLSRDAGQTRVPEPPHIMTGRIFTFSCSILTKNRISVPKFVL